MLPTFQTCVVRLDVGLLDLAVFDHERIPLTTRPPKDA